MTREITLDARKMDAPEPLFATLDCLDAMQSGESLRLLIHREPVMLYPQLQEMKIPWQVVAHGHPDWIILIGPVPQRNT